MSILDDLTGPENKVNWQFGTSCYAKHWYINVAPPRGLVPHPGYPEVTFKVKDQETIDGLSYWDDPYPLKIGDTAYKAISEKQARDETIAWWLARADVDPRRDRLIEFSWENNGKYTLLAGAPLPEKIAA